MVVLLFACLSSQADHPTVGCMHMQARSPYSHSWRLQSEPRESPSLMAIPHECRLYKYVGPNGIPYALVVAHDMFNLQELLEKISVILDYVNSMLPLVNADDPIGFLRQFNVQCIYASLKTAFFKKQIGH